MIIDLCAHFETLDSKQVNIGSKFYFHNVFGLFFYNHYANQLWCFTVYNIIKTNNMDMVEIWNILDMVEFWWYFCWGEVGVKMFVFLWGCF